MDTSKFFALPAFSIFLSSFFPNPVPAQAGSIEVAGEIDVETVWSADTVRVTGDITVADDVVLTIEPGTRIEFQGYYMIDVQGTVLALGTSDQKILFTVSDTNGFSRLDTTLGSWFGITYDNSKHSANGAMFDNQYSSWQHCIFEYGKRLRVSPKKDSISFIHISSFSGVDFSHCVFRQCISQKYLIHCSFASPYITHSKIINSRAEAMICVIGLSQAIFANNAICNNRGSGFSIWFSSPKITGNLIANNSKILGTNSFAGAAIFLSRSNSVISNNTICNNLTDGKGGGLFSILSEPTMYNNIIWGNEAAEGDQVQISNSENHSPDFYNCLIEGDSAGFGGVKFSGEYLNNLSDDPLFLDPTAGTGVDYDALLGDWRVGELSPCINSGLDGVPIDLPEYDITGERRTRYGITDIGAYEFQRAFISAAGNITTDTIWLADTVKVTDNTFVSNGTSLKISAGVTVEMQGNYVIQVYGSIKAEGTGEEKILFTVADTTGFHDPDLEMGGWNGLHFFQTSEENDSSKLDYCIFEYSKRPGKLGGGVYISGFSKLRISDCEFRYNMADRGGGLYISDATIRIERSSFHHNIAFLHGGGLGVAYSRSVLDGVRIWNNRCLKYGGGLFLGGSPVDPTLYNCIIYNNIAWMGGGVHCGTHALLLNNTICNNRSAGGGAGLYTSRGFLEIYNTILWGNRSDSASTHQIRMGGQSSLWAIQNNIEFGMDSINSIGDGLYEDNIDTLPEFSSPSSVTGTFTGDDFTEWYPLTISPCINKGYNGEELAPFLTTVDFNGNPRIHNSIIDLGAVENQEEMFRIEKHPQNSIRCEGDELVLFTEVWQLARYQWLKDGKEIEGATDFELDLSPLEQADEGNYACRVSDGYGSIESHPAYVLVRQKPVFLANEETTWTEPGTSIRVSPYFRGTDPDFTWEKDGVIMQGETIPELDLVVSDSSHEGRYRAIISNSCGSDTSEYFNVYLAPQLCMVTVSPISGDNLVVWEKNSRAPVMAYNVYRESVAAGIYDLLKTIPFDELSIYTDTFADPTVQAYLYKITAIDTGGMETDQDLCKPHKTIHLLVSTNPELNTTQLQWDRYYGFDYQTYTIYRSFTGLNYDPVHSLSANLNSWTDPDPSTLSQVSYYRIAVEKPDPCIPEGGDKKAGTGPYVNSLSNMDNNKLKSGQSPPDTIIIDNNSIDEGMMPGTVIGKLFTFDADSFDSHTYKFVPGEGAEDNTSFTIAGDLLLGSVSFNYEDKNEYRVRIRVSDEAGNYFERPLIIYIVDMPEVSAQGMTGPGALEIFPNPFSQSTTIRFPNPGGDPHSLTLTDLSGKVCRIVDDIRDDKYILYREGLNKGLYFVKLRGPEVFRVKLVID